MKRVVVIDDKKIFLDRWDYFFPLEKVKVLKFFDPLHFLDICRKNKQIGNQIDVLVIDKIGPNYDSEEIMFSEDFRNLCKDFSGQIILCSSIFESHLPKCPSGVDFVCAKREEKLFNLVESILQC